MDRRAGRSPSFFAEIFSNVAGMTGVESVRMRAAFKPPMQKRAATMMIMAVLSITMFLCITLWRKPTAFSHERKLSFPNSAWVFGVRVVPLPVPAHDADPGLALIGLRGFPALPQSWPATAICRANS